MDIDTLYAAAIAGDADAIAKLEMKADRLTGDGKTVLHIESKAGNTVRVQFILKQFASKNLLIKLTEHNHTALHLAAYDGHTKVAEVLIDEARRLLSSSTANDAISPFQAFLRQGDREMDTALHAAVMNGHLAIVKLLVEADPSDTHIRNIDDGKTPLYIAAEEGYIDIIKVICTTCIAPSLDGPDGSTALHAAIKNLDLGFEVVEVLLAAARLLPSSSEHDDDTHTFVSSFQAFLRQGDKDLNTALHIAVMQHNLAIVKLLVEADPSDTHIPNDEGKTPIYIAVEKGYDDIVEIICTTCTALSLDGPDCTALRIKNIDQGKNPGGTLYEIFDTKDALFEDAIAGDADAIAKLEMEADRLNKDEETILHVESKKGNTEHVRYILREFAHKNLLFKQDYDENTALHWASFGGHTQVVEVLIDAARQLPNEDPVTSFQAFLRQPDDHWNTALHLAVMEGHASIVKLLVEADPSDTHFQNRVGKTPMYLAAEEGYNEIVEIIFTTCTAPSLDGPDGSTVVRVKNLDQAKNPGEILYKIMDKDDLYAAAIAGDADAIVKLEMEADRLNKDEETILHVESKKGNTEHVRYILREFAHKNLLIKLDYDENTALHWASLHGHTQVVEVLIDAARQFPNDNTHDDPVTSFQAFLRQPDDHRNTALHLAVMEGHDSIVKLLVEADPSDTHFQNRVGKTPMYLAAEEGYNDIVEIIFTTCTAPSLDGPDGSTVVRVKNLDQAKNPSETLYKIVDKGDLYAAAIAGDADAIAKLETRADKLMNAYGGTILHAESREGNTEHVRFILREFASKNLLFKLGNQQETALTWAAYFGHTEVVEVLIDAATHLPPPSSATDNPITSFQAFLRHADQDLETALYVAVKEGHPSVVKLLVEADPSATHIQNKDGKTPMYIAVEEEYYDIADIIFTTCTAPSFHGPDGSIVVRVKNLDQAQSPSGTLYKIMDRLDVLYDAAIAGDAVAIAELEMETEKLNEHGETILHVESERGNTERVRFILKEFANKNLLVKLSKYEHTALHLALYQRCTEVAEILIDAARHWPVTSFHAFLRQGDLDMDTALHAAVMNGNVAIVKLLVEADPYDRHIQNDEGKTPMYIAVEQGFNDIAEMISTTCTAPSLDGPNGSAVVCIKNLVEAKSLGGPLYKIMDKDALYAAAIAGDADATAILEMKADRLNKDEQTILHAESREGNTEHVRFILREFASKNLLVKLGNQQETALTWAAYFGHTEVVEVLIDAARHLPPFSASDNPITSFQDFLRHADKDSETALHAAVKNGHLIIAKLLVEADPTDKHIQNNDGKTPIYMAAEEGYYDIVKLICTSCAPPLNLDGPGGSTVLHAVIRDSNHDNEVVEVVIGAARLLSASSDDDNPHSLVSFFQAFLRQGDKDMNTALHIAVLQGNLATAKLLVEADPSHRHSQNKNGKTPMYIAAENGYMDIVKVMCTTCTAPSLDGPGGSTSLHAAIYHDIEMVNLIIGAARHLTPSSDNDDNTKSVVGPFQAFLRQGDEHMDTALHIAVMQDKLATAKLLVEADPSDTVHLKNKEGETPMYIAAERGYHDIMKMICTTCTAPSLDGPGGSTVLHAVIRDPNHDIKVVEVLIGAARLLSSSSDDDNTHSLVSVFQALLRKGDKDTNTALHIAVMQGNLATAKLLVEADPTDRYIQNDEGKTPMYIAAERGYYDIMKMICTICTAPPNLDAPGGSTTLLHVAIKNLDKAKKEDRDVIGIIINAVKSAGERKDAVKSAGERKDAVKSAGERKVRYGNKSLLELFNKTAEDRCTVLELAVERNYVDVVEVILAENPAYQLRNDSDLIGLMPLIYKAMDKEYRDIVKSLTECYQKETAVSSVDGDMASLISAIRMRKKESVLSKLDDNNAKDLVTFADNLGWTALHHAAYHKFDSIISVIIEAQKRFVHKFVYQNMVSTPFHVAAEKGYTSTVLLLMQLWPSSSSSYTALDKNGKNILHIAALQRKKEMIEGILKYCPEKYKKKFVNERDDNGDTPLHLLISRGCFIPQLLTYEGLDIRIGNKQGWTPPDMLYFEDQVIDDQVQIKIILDGIQIDSTRDIISSSVLSSKRKKKDEIFRKKTESMKLEKYAQIKEDTRAIANCFAEAIAGYPISKAALEMKAETLNESGETILHVESKRGDIENVRFIVSAIANKSLLVKLDGLKQTALHLAAKHGHAQVAEALIDAARILPPSAANDDTHNPVSSFQGFIRQANCQQGNTALHLAVLHGNVAIVKLLVEADSNHTHVQNNEGKTPIFIAAENGNKGIVKEICTIYTALCLDGPGGRTTALHALIQNIGQAREEANDVIRMMVHAAKSWSRSEEIFSRTDESGSTILQLAMKINYVDAVKLILLEDPVYQPAGGEIKRNGLMRLISEAIDNHYSNDIIKHLSDAYEDGINGDHKGVLDLILGIKSREEASVSGHLTVGKKLVTFKEDNGWTPLHYAVYHEFDSIIGDIIEAQENLKHQFVYENMVSTPFHVAVRHGYTSTMKRLMQSWPTPSPAVTAANSPYTAVDENGQNILHLAAAANNKAMVRGILKYCPKEFKEEILKKQDTNGDTPLHILISHGCFIPQLIKYEEVNTMARNKNKFTPWDMLYFKSDVVAEQVRIKIALDKIQTHQRAWHFRAESTGKKTDIFTNVVAPSKKRIKDVIFNETEKSLKDEDMKQALQIYRDRINSQIVVSALITTITFTVGFTMPGGLHQSGEVDEGSAVLSKKAMFNAFMVLDALALVLSTCSMFIYFLQSMYKDPYQVFSLHATTTVLNIVSIMLMMLIFITGTYVVLSHSPALAITVCVIGSLFFLFVIVYLIKLWAGRGQKLKV